MADLTRKAVLWLKLLGSSHKLVQGFACLSQFIDSFLIVVCSFLEKSEHLLARYHPSLPVGDDLSDLL